MRLTCRYRRTDSRGDDRCCATCLSVAAGKTVIFDREGNGSPRDKNKICVTVGPRNKPLTYRVRNESTLEKKEEKLFAFLYSRLLISIDLICASPSVKISSEERKAPRHHRLAAQQLSALCRVGRKGGRDISVAGG